VLWWLVVEPWGLSRLVFEYTEPEAYLLFDNNAFFLLSAHCSGHLLDPKNPIVPFIASESVVVVSGGTLGAFAACFYIPTTSETNRIPIYSAHFMLADILHYLICVLD
jgi:hypothetical protein